MNQAKKELLKLEIKQRCNNARLIGTTEYPYSTISRLSCYLMKDCKVKGNISTVRQYLLTYNRKELRSILVAMKLNRQRNGFNPLNSGNSLNLSFAFSTIEDFKKITI